HTFARGGDKHITVAQQLCRSLGRHLAHLTVFKNQARMIDTVAPHGTPADILDKNPIHSTSRRRSDGIVKYRNAAKANPQAAFHSTYN
ncbi:TPA: hypothetical protein ACJKA0_002264, partial [Neisseria meningitidis]